MTPESALDRSKFEPALAVFELIANNVAIVAKTVRPATPVNLYPVKFGGSDYATVALDPVNKKPDTLVLLLVEQEVPSQH